MSQPRTPKVNSHVARLNRFLPFSAVHDQIYEEYQTGEDSLDLPTVALAYTEQAIRDGARCVVLTGDAGHGKTHMCRRLIESVLGHPTRRARELLVGGCDGKARISASDERGGPMLRIHKDFSELDLDSAVDLLEGIHDRRDETLVVCANEGRLRAVVNSASAGTACLKIMELFDGSFTSGRCSNDGEIHIVNLNYQSVAAKGTNGYTSLLRRTLDSWVGDGRRWGERGCGSCSLAKICPIRRNRSLLVDDGEVAARRIDRLEELCEAVERLGHVITIREMLMLSAYLITGGLSCEDVRRKGATADHQPGWQHAWVFYNLLFQAPPGASDDRIYKGIPILEVFRRLDPGAIASRPVDEKVLNVGGVFPPNELDLVFRIAVSGTTKLIDASEGIDDFMGNPQSKADLMREADVTATAVRALRRRAVFDDATAEGTLMSRLGFRNGDAFLGMLSGRLTAPELVKLKNTVIAGLHAIQGLRMSRSETTLHLVDPAFGRARAEAAIIARRIPTGKLLLLPAREAWSESAGRWSVSESVDWIDRTVIVRVREQGDSHTDLPLDLLSFECVTRAASGYVPEGFYSHENRRIRAFLGRLAAQGRAEAGEISLFIAGSIQNVSIDMGVIQVGGV